MPCLSRQRDNPMRRVKGSRFVAPLGMKAWVATILGNREPVDQARFVFRVDGASASRMGQHAFQRLVVGDEQVAGG